MRIKGGFSTKIFLANILIIIISMCSILAYFYNFLKVKEETQFTKALQTLNIKLSEQIDTLIDNMDKIALQIASNPYIATVFNEIPQDSTINTFSEDHFLRFKIRDFVNSYNFKNDLATRICLYDEYNNFIDVGYKLTDTEPVQNFFQSKEFEKILDFFQINNSKKLFIPPRQDPFSLKPQYGSPLTVFSVIRPIKNYALVGSNVGGYVEVQLEYSRLEELFLSLGPSMSTLIIDDMNNIIYPLDVVDEYFDPLKFTETEYLITESLLEETNFRVVLMQQKESLFSSYKTLQYMVISIFFIVFFISVTSQYILILYFTRPLKQLQSSVEAMNIDNLSLKLLDGHSNNEFTQLNQAFIKMFEHLNISIQHSILARTSALQSHLLALQAQINPHFIHNILTVISVIAEENDVPKIESMCRKLSKMLRFSSSYKEMYVTLEEELQYTQSYLELMQERYENMFSFELEIESQARYVEVPKLIIQPITENCFQHGFKQKPIPWKLKIRCYIEKNKWFVKIEDNGIGFEERLIAQFKGFIEKVDLNNSADELTKLQIGGLCLSNLYLRLGIIYKDEVTFKLSNDSTLGGATVMIGGMIEDDKGNGSRG